jgi:hypothetical protein
LDQWGALDLNAFTAAFGKELAPKSVKVSALQLGGVPRPTSMVTKVVPLTKHVRGATAQIAQPMHSVRLKRWTKSPA